MQNSWSFVAVSYAPDFTVSLLIKKSTFPAFEMRLFSQVKASTNDQHQNKMSLPGVMDSASEWSSANCSLPPPLCVLTFLRPPLRADFLSVPHIDGLSHSSRVTFSNLLQTGFPLKHAVTEILMCLKFSQPRGYMFGYKQDQSCCRSYHDYSSCLQS